MRHTGRMQPIIIDLYAAQAATGIRPGTLRQWLRRGKLTHHGHDKAGRALVDLNELPATLASAKAA